MSCAVVPIRTPTEGASDQIEHGKNGIIFPCGDYKALASELRGLADDPRRRQVLAEASLQTARERFSAHQMVEKTIETYRELIEGTPPDPRTLVPSPKLALEMHANHA
jgi:glycosyltransferase involved in cell wall biosynthesis